MRELLLKWYCDVNANSLYYYITPKLDILFSVFGKMRGRKISHCVSDKISMFVLNVLEGVTLKSQRSRKWWVYRLGRTERQWGQWYYSQFEITNRERVSMMEKHRLAK